MLVGPTLLLVLAQGAGALPGALADPLWMTRAPAPDERVVELGWGAREQDRALDFAEPALLVGVWAPEPAGFLRVQQPAADAAPPADAPGDAPVGGVAATRLLDLAALAEDPSVDPALYAQRVGGGLLIACAVPLHAGARVVHADAGERPAPLRLLVRTGGADVPPLPPPAVRDGFKAGAAFRGTPPEGVEGADPGEFSWTFRGHGVVRWWELSFVGDTPPASLVDTMRALVLRVEIGSEDPATPGQLLFELPLGDFLGSPLRPERARAAWCALADDGTRFRFLLPMPYRDGLVLRIRSPLDAAARFRLDAGADPIADPAAVPPLALHAGWMRGVGGEAPPRLQVAGPARLAGWSFSARAAAPGGLRLVGPAGAAKELQRAGGGRLLSAPALDGPQGYGETTLTRHYLFDGPCGAGGLDFVPGIATGEEVLDWSAVAWWYAAPGSPSTWGPVAAADGVAAVGTAQVLEGWPARRPGSVPPPPFTAVEGALEGERLEVGSMTLGSRDTLRGGEAWSALRYLHWQGATGQQCNLRFPVTEPAEYRVLVRLAEGAEFGAVQLQLDGRDAGPPRDCRAEGEAAPGAELEIARLRLLPRADHVLTLRSLDGGAVGLDYLRLERVKPAAPDEGR